MSASSIRRFVIRATEYDDVLKWLKRKSQEASADDEKQAVVVEKTYRVPSDFFPKIRWVHGRELQLQMVLEEMRARGWLRILKIPFS